MLDAALLEALELLTHSEGKVILAVAEYLKSRRAEGVDLEAATEAMLAELSQGEPHFTAPDDGLSPT